MSDLVLYPYLFTVLCATRMIAGHIAWNTAKSYRQEKPDGMDWTMGALGGLFLGAIWPALLMGFLLMKATSLTLPAIGAERAALEKQKETKRRELEQELGLD